MLIHKHGRRPRGVKPMSWSEFYRIVNSELNDDIGNFVHRVLSMIDKRLGGVVPEPAKLSSEDKDVMSMANDISWKAVESLEDIAIRKATDYILDVARLGNRYLNEREPWALLRSNVDEARGVLWTAASIVKKLAHLLAPFMPRIADELWSMMGYVGSVHERIWDKELSEPIKPGLKLGEVRPLFKKLPSDFLDRIDEIIEDARRRANSKRPPLLREYVIVD